jgi:hypothetical protein
MKKNTIVYTTFLSAFLLCLLAIFEGPITKIFFRGYMGWVSYSFMILLYLPGIIFGLALILAVRQVTTIRKILFLFLSIITYTSIAYFAGLRGLVENNPYLISPGGALGAVLIAFLFEFILFKSRTLFTFKDFLKGALIGFLSSLIFLLYILLDPERKIAPAFVSEIASPIGVIIIWQISIGIYLNFIYNRTSK